MTVVTSDDEMVLIVCLVLAHSVFNVVSARHKAFMAYVQRYILDIEDGCHVPHKVLRFHQETAAPDSPLR